MPNREYSTMRVTRESLVQTLIKKLCQMIDNGEFRPNESLPTQKALAEAFGVSRTVVREAMQGLRSLGLIEISPGRGSHICKDPERVFHLGKAAALHLKELPVLELYEARFILERELAALAAQRANAKHICEIRESLERMRHAMRNVEEFARNDLQFHMRVAKAASNRVLEQFYHMSEELLSKLLLYVDSIPGVIETAIPLHDAILEGIERKDPFATRAAVEKWKKYVEQVLHTYGVKDNDTELQSIETLDSILPLDVVRVREAVDKRLNGLGI